MIILSWTTKKHQNTLSRPLQSNLKKIQGLPLKFKDFLRLCEPWNKVLDELVQPVLSTITDKTE